jgi:hypothetical protein
MVLVLDYGAQAVHISFHCTVQGWRVLCCVAMMLEGRISLFIFVSGLIFRLCVYAFFYFRPRLVNSPNLKLLLLALLADVAILLYSGHLCFEFVFLGSHRCVLRWSRSKS